MFIRRATGDEMLALWGDAPDAMRPTTAFFYYHIRKGTAEFWTYDDNGSVTSELYVFRDLDDKDYANGRDRAYLCGFRIPERLRGKGYGTRLITYVMDHLKNEGITTVTIGVEESEEANVRLYRKLGFLEKVKDCYDDPCDVDENMQPVASEVCWLLKKDL